MHLARHSISPTAPIQVLDARFDADAKIFTAATPDGFAIYRSCPLELLRKREFTNGTLTTVLPLHTTNLLFLVGGGASPLHPPNKVVVWDERTRREVAALEFRERVRGLAVRRGMLVVALRRRAVAFTIEGDALRRVREWDTCDNQRGLVALASAPHATLLAIAGRQTGHVQLIHLEPCPPPPPAPGADSVPPAPRRSAKARVSFIAAHESTLAALAVLPNGTLIATASERGTLVRVWDAHEGRLVRELRRGLDKVEIYGLAFRPDGRDLVAWSDKGTVHVFSLEDVADPKGKGKGKSSLNLQSTFKPLKDYVKLPSYFGSEWSYAQYRIPAQRAHIALSSASAAVASGSGSGVGGSILADVAADERCVVAWIRAPAPAPSDEYQLVALTYSGGWYRIGLPSSSEAATKAGGNTSGAGAGSSASTVAGTKPTSPRNLARPLTPSLAAHSAASYAARQIPRPRSVSGSTTATSARTRGTTRMDERQEREKGDKDKAGRACILLEFRRFGRWDGWG